MEDQKDLPPTQPIENNELPDDINHDAVQPPKPKSKKKWLWIGLAAVLIAAGLGYWFFVREDEAQASINSYDECMAAGYPVMESYPEQCAVPGGQSFTRQLSEEEQASLDEQNEQESDLVTPDQLSGEVDEYTNTEFGFQLSYPVEWGKLSTEVSDFTNEDNGGVAGGKTLVISFEKSGTINIGVATKDFFMSKGPYPTSYILHRGYYESDGKYYVNEYDGSKDKEVLLQDAAIENETDALYWIEPANEAVNTEKIYSYTFNIKVGGLVLSTSDEKSLELLKEMASLVEIY